MKNGFSTFYRVFVFLFVGIYGANAQEAQFKPFIPAGYSLFTSSSGDINLDGIDDAALVLKMDGEEEYPDTTRPLILLWGNADGKYTFYARNDNVILCVACGGVSGDPFEGISIDKGMLNINHYGGSTWRWSRNISFKYYHETRQLILLSDNGISYHISTPENYTKDEFNKEQYGKISIFDYSNKNQ